ncbi:hypothetical protein NDU88_000547 [Pleurodeles waltl]|uniref:CCHC-type domain-containing protein n=1 Tax=Pleurodeles waltl TaxID=8319 RepID=A0AAV7S8G7_PLEWA|nr:hypothetical protein NDU88_000547 [Pleurodeles waltl]
MLAARADEMDLVNARALEKQQAIKVERADLVKTQQLRKSNQPPSVVKQSGRCDYCGMEEHFPKECPARERTCSNCGWPNHFAAVCMGGYRGRGSEGRREWPKAIKQLAIADPRPHNTRTQAGRGWVADSSEEYEEEEAFLISFNENPKQQRRPQPTCEVDIEVSTVTALIDIWASVNVMGIQQY